MKKSLILQTIITMLAIVVVGGFGVYALLLGNQTRTSQVTINVIDQRVDISITGTAEWVEDGAEDKTFSTTTGDDGLELKEWQMRDLMLTKTHIDTPANLVFTIINMRPTDAYDLKIVVEGVAFDEHARFATYATCVCDDNQVSKNQPITGKMPKFEMTVGGQTQEIVLTFSYFLLQFNSDFDINQDITITISSEVKPL